MCLFLFVFFFKLFVCLVLVNMYFFCVLWFVYMPFGQQNLVKMTRSKNIFYFEHFFMLFFLLCFGQNVYFIFGALIFLYAFWSTKSCQNDKDKPIFFILNMFLCKQDLATSRQFGPKGR